MKTKCWRFKDFTFRLTILIVPNEEKLDRGWEASEARDQIINDERKLIENKKHRIKLRQKKAKEHREYHQRYSQISPVVFPLDSRFRPNAEYNETITIQSDSVLEIYKHVHLRISFGYFHYRNSSTKIKMSTFYPKYFQDKS